MGDTLILCLAIMDPQGGPVSSSLNSGELRLTNLGILISLILVRLGLPDRVFTLEERIPSSLEGLL